MQQRLLLHILLLVQHVSGITMSITRSSRAVAACGISYCGFQVAGLVRSWVLCVRFNNRIWGNKMPTRCNRGLAFYFHILTTMHGQNHIKQNISTPPCLITGVYTPPRLTLGLRSWNPQRRTKQDRTEHFFNVTVNYITNQSDLCRSSQMPAKHRCSEHS